eukprot:TRINITY_DN9520_c0_g1_i1.p1 TRINITY_DN9520_c0_g1~~TRINITY_DN9520_c0_g1_i1.p1  ORF type:complete len:103 (+),score=8.30 TRINITY_DN9520_c0_g1_i1:247-555(+)
MLGKHCQHNTSTIAKHDLIRLHSLNMLGKHCQHNTSTIAKHLRQSRPMFSAVAPNDRQRIDITSFRGLVFLFFPGWLPLWLAGRLLTVVMRHADQSSDPSSP